jgi:hypothetical protein
MCAATEGTPQVDARPSDNVNLAIRTAAPIFVAAPLLRVRPTEEPPAGAVWYELVDDESLAGLSTPC